WKVCEGSGEIAKAFDNHKEPSMKSPKIGTLAALLSLAAILPASCANAVTGQPSAKSALCLEPQGLWLEQKKLERIDPGMSEEQVRALLGPPRYTTRFRLSHTIDWNYDYRDLWGYDATFSVTFNDRGVVVSKFSKRYQG